MIAVLPSALAEVLCRYCRGCDYGERRHPRTCRAVKNFINQVRQKSNQNGNQNKKTKTNSNYANKGAR